MIARFVIVSPPRVGSNLLLQVLNSTTEKICCYSELFHPTAKDFMVGGHFTRPIIPYFHQAGLTVREYLKQVVWNSGASADACIGFKLQPNYPLVYESLTTAREMGADFLYLTRENKVEMVLSKMVSEARQQWWHYGEASSQGPIILDLERAKKVAWNLRMAEQKVMNYLPKTTRFVTYEQLFQGGFEAVLRWLGFSGRPRLEDSSIPQKSPEKRDIIQNYDQVAAIVSDTYYG